MGVSRTFLAGNHLLLVDTFGYRESYRRVELGDLQAVIIRRTARGVVWTIALVLLTLLFAIPAALNAGTVSWVLVVFASLAALGLLVHLAVGATCVVHARTPAQLVELRALRRSRAAARFLSRLRPLVAEAQGEATAQEIRERFSEIVPLPAPPSPVTASADALQPHPPRQVGGWVHALLAGLLAADAAASVGQLLLSSALLDQIGLGVYLGAFAVSIWALFRQRNSTLSRLLRRWAWWTFGYLCVYSLIGTFWGASLVLVSLEQGGPLGDLSQVPGYRVLLLVFIVTSLVMVGFWALSAWGKGTEA
jgi:hypothetical protein